MILYYANKEVTRICSCLQTFTLIVNLDFQLSFFTTVQVSLQTLPEHFTSVFVHFRGMFVLNYTIYRVLLKYDHKKHFSTLKSHN